MIGYPYLASQNILKMKITLERKNKAVHLIGTNESGLTVSIDGSPKIGGEELGPRPMELVLMAAGSCSSMDVLSILQKMKQEVKSYQVEVEGERDMDAIPSVFTSIHLKFILKGDLDESKVARAIELSLDKYCSVTHMLRGSVKISSSFEII